MSYTMLVVTGGTPAQFVFEDFATMHAVARQAVKDGAFKIPGMLLCIGPKTVLVLLSEVGMKSREADMLTAQKTGMLPNRVTVNETDFVVVVQNGQQELEPMVFSSMEACQHILDEALQQGFIENVFQQDHEHLLCVLGPGVLVRAMTGEAYIAARREKSVQHMRQQMQPPPGAAPGRIVLPGRR